MRYLMAFLAVTFLNACDSDTPSPNTMDGSIDSSNELDEALPSNDGASPSDATIEDAAVVGSRPERMPLEGAANLAGATNLTQRVSEGQARAGKVVLEAEKLTGPEANCRIGDFRLDNARVSICIQAETTFSQFSFFGGNIVDAHRADRPGTDAFREVFIAPGLGEARVDEIGIVKDGSDGEAAVIRTVGATQGALILQGVLPNGFLPPPAEVTTEYHLAPDSDTVEILTWVHSKAPVSVGFELIDFLYFGDRTKTFVPDQDPEAPLGPMAYVAATASNVSYRWDTDFAPFSLFIASNLGLPGAPIQSPRAALNVDDIRLFVRRLTIGTGDVESLREHPEGGQSIEVNGRPNSHLVFQNASRELITTLQLNDDGSGVVHLSEGVYSVASWTAEPSTYEETITIAPDTSTLQLTQPAPGTLTIHLEDTTGQPLDGMVRLSGSTNRIHFVLGSEPIVLPEGDWTLTASRGWHYGIQTDTVTVNAGESVERTYQLTEEISLEGFTSGEFHQHASPSLDSEVAVEQRVKSNLAAGVDFMVPSDHDIIYPYQSLIENMGLSARISAPLTGEEISPLFTHIGAYGIPYDPYGGAGGAIRIPVQNEMGRWRVPEVPELIATARAKGAELIQINHARASQGYFDHVDYEPERDINELDPTIFSADFDTIEVFNSPSNFCRNLQDWHGLLNQGLKVTAVGNSDTHSETQVPGYPRNYLRTLSPNPVEVSKAEIVDSVKRGATTIGGGAVLDFPSGPQPGDTVALNEGPLLLNVRARTPSFTSIDRILVLVNGQIAQERTIQSTPENLVDFDEELAIEITEDSHVTILALSEAGIEFLRPGAPIFAMSNPIWVDLNDDGFTFPGPRPVERLELHFCRD